MKVTNMTSSRGNKVANQFIIEDIQAGPQAGNHYRYFQSYDSVIVRRRAWTVDGVTEYEICLDETYWDYSVTTGKYRNQFLGEGIAETRKKI